VAPSDPPASSSNAPNTPASGSAGSGGGGTPPSASTRIIKRYSNRKLYDTVESRYVTLPQIAELVRKGEDVRIIDNNSKEDLTSVTLAQILYEEERKQSRALPLAALKDLIHTSGEKIITSLRESPMGKLIGPKSGDPTAPDATAKPEAPPPEVADIAAANGQSESAQAQSNRLIGLYEQVDKRVREALENLSPTSQVEKLSAEVRKLTQRLEELEARLPGAKKPKDRDE
jgi:polyhydroxyalkanoate synthesis repressor PhaR